LKSGWSAGQPKRHLNKLIEAGRGDKSSLLAEVWRNLYLPVSARQVDC
jgi:hypothetical protein